MKSLIKKAAIAGLAVGVALSAGMAYALWSANGSGSGSAKALTAQSVTVTAATATADLYPFFTLTNPNPYPITFTSMTSGTVTSGDEANCPAANVTVANASGLSLAVAGSASNVARSIADVVTLASAAPNGCQGVTFTIALTLTGSQS
jgi:hypothetical protein